jgi:trehalose 6-phosphate synthase/phosphatase
MQKFKSIILSNRLPISVSKENGKLTYKVSNGGLATAMSSLEDDARLWIGWAGIASDEVTQKEKEEITEKLLEDGCYPVFISQEEIENFYEGYSNDTLWPLFHYFQSFVQHNEEYWKTYCEVNKKFVKVLRKLATDDAKIWVHDYQLLLTPGMIRKTLPDTTIGFFLHIPFPSYEVFRQLPNRHEIMEGMLGADLLGFHIYDYARHFLSSAERIEGIEHEHGCLRYKGREVLADTFPIGIDYQKYVDALNTKEVKTEIRMIKDHYENQEIILSVDRLDYTKGILQRLEGFELFLNEHPEYIEKVTLLMVAVPSRTEVETYKELRNEIELSISRINGRFASVNWTPISYQFKNQPFERIVALYASSSVALVTPLRDGMNLVAKEYVASKQDTSGVLVLSEMAGAIDELPESLSINPNSTRTISDALLRALTMDENEKRKRLTTMQQRLKDYDVKDWAADFNEQLATVKKDQKDNQEKLISKEVKKQLVAAFKRAPSRLLLLDYDGVLKSFVKSSKANAASPSKEIYKVIEKLSDEPNTTVCIISGRTKEDMMSWFDKLDNLVLVAEHGAWVKMQDEWREIHTSFSEHKNKLLSLMKKYSKRTAGASVEEKGHSLVWHYRRVKSELAYARNSSLIGELERLVADTDLEVHSGNKIVEVKPQKVNKGNIALELYEQFNADFVLCIGDDYTDEDMFEALPEEAFTIKVGLEDTAALFSLEYVSDVHQLLTDMSEALD